MLSRVGRAQGFLCLFLFMRFNSNGLQKLAVEPNPGTEPSMHKNGWRVQSVFDGRNSHAMTESTSCREAAQSNTEFRGIEFVPSVVPEPTALFGLGAATLVLGGQFMRCRRKKA